mgnify:CR=1 FL=1
MIWPVLWAVVILVLTLMPGSDVPAWPWAEAVQLDKFVHAGLFGVQTILLGRAVVPGGRIRSVFIIAMVASIAYGGGIEILQGLMGLGRDPDIADFAADSVGALLGYGFLKWRFCA